MNESLEWKSFIKCSPKSENVFAELRKEYAIVVNSEWKGQRTIGRIEVAVSSRFIDSDAIYENWGYFERGANTIKHIERLNIFNENLRERLFGGILIK